MKIILFATLLFFICAQPAQAQVVLSEVYPAPTSEENEWIELYNTGEEPVDISGWKLFEHFTNKSELTTFSEMSIQPNSFYVFELVSNKLNNSEEKVTLENALGSELSSLHFINSQSQKSVSFLFENEQTIGTTLEITAATKNSINPLQPIPTPTPSPTVNPTPTHTIIPPSNEPTITPTPAMTIQQEEKQIQDEPKNKIMYNFELELHKRVNEKLKIPGLKRIEKEGLEKQLPKLSYLIQKKVSKEGVISAIIGGTLLLFTGLLL